MSLFDPFLSSTKKHFDPQHPLGVLHSPGLSILGTFEHLCTHRKQLALSTQLPSKNASGDSLTLFNATIVAFDHVRQSGKAWAELAKQNCLGKTFGYSNMKLRFKALKPYRGS